MGTRTRVTFSLDSVLVPAVSHGIVPEASGELRCILCLEQTALALSSFLCTLRCSCILPLSRCRWSMSRIAPSLAVHYPLLPRFALVLQGSTRRRGWGGAAVCQDGSRCLSISLPHTRCRCSASSGPGGTGRTRTKQTAAYHRLYSGTSGTGLIPSDPRTAVGQTEPRPFRPPVLPGHLLIMLDHVPDGVGQAIAG